MRFFSICYKITNMISRVIFLASENNNGAWPFVIFAIVLISALILFTVLFIIYAKKREMQYQDQLRKKFSVNRTFIVDFKSLSVEYFNFRNLKEVKKISYDEFLNRFEPKEQSKMANWLGDLASQTELLTGDKAIFVTDVKIKDSGKGYCTRILFNVKLVDKEKGLIYLDSILLNNLPSEYNRMKKGIFKKDVFMISEIARFYAHGLFQKGSLIFVKLFKKTAGNIRINEYEFRYILINAIYKRKNSLNCYIMFSNENPLEFTILNTKAQVDYQVSKEIKKTISALDEILEIYGFKNAYDLVVVGSKTVELDNDFMKAFETLKNCSRLVKDAGNNSLLFKNDNRENRNVEESYKAEVNKIIKMQLVNIEFLPLIKIASKRILTQGYIASVKPKGSFIENINDAKFYAKKYNLDKELFTMIARKMIPTFNNEKENNNYRLYFNVKLNEIPYVLRSLPHMNLATNTKIGLIIDNNDFVDNETNTDLLNNIKNLQSRSYEVYIKVKIGDYNLRNATYSLFDGFLIDTHLPNKNENRDYLQTRTLLDKLVKYKTPIISVGLETWNEVELLVKSGVYLFSNEVISNSSPMLLPVDRKIQKKLLNMYKK